MATTESPRPHFDKEGNKKLLEAPLLEECEEEQDESQLRVHIPMFARLYRIFAKIYAKVKAHSFRAPGSPRGLRPLLTPAARLAA